MTLEFSEAIQSLHKPIIGTQINFNIIYTKIAILPNQVYNNLLNYHQKALETGENSIPTCSLKS